MRRVLGIDPGTQNTGFGVVGLAGTQLRYLGHGTIRNSSKTPLASRLARIFAELNAAFDTYQPHEVSIEGIFHSRNAQSALKLGHARGVALLAAELKGMAVVEYTPMQVKSAVVGYGRAEKSQVQEMVRLLLRLPEPAGADASDALAVAICHVQSQRTSDALTARRVVQR